MTEPYGAKYPKEDVGYAKIKRRHTRFQHWAEDIPLPEGENPIGPGELDLWEIFGWVRAAEEGYALTDKGRHAIKAINSIRAKYAQTP